MIKKTLLMALTLACGLTGCRDPGVDAPSRSSMNHEGATEAPEKQSTGVAPTANSRGVRGLERPLPGDIEALPFPFHLNLDQDTGGRRLGKQTREVGIEFLGPTPAEAEAKFSALILKRGGSVDQRDDRGSSLRLVYTLQDGTAMLAWFRPEAPAGERYALQMLDATGTLYLAWPYIDKDTE